jgi:hypothetical protein
MEHKTINKNNNGDSNDMDAVYVNQYNMKATAVVRQTTGVVKYNCSA